MKVLILDDSPTSLALVEEYLKEMGHTAIISTDGVQCVSLYNAHQPDLILLEAMMQPLSGYACARQLRATLIGRDWVPIVIMSAIGDDQSIADALAAGGDETLEKPFTKLRFETKVRSMERIVAMRMELVATTAALADANDRLNQMSMTDALTGVANRRAFDLALDRALALAQQSSDQGRFLTVMMVDIDHFKQFNDQYGHLAGDVSLRQVAESLCAALVCEEDGVFRYGGEEFVVLMRGQTKQQVLAQAECLCTTVAACKNPYAPLTISVGVNHCPVDVHTQAQSLVNGADQALYQAKEHGRNRVALAK